MKQINWQHAAEQVRTIFPAVLQIAQYSRNRWILIFNEEPDNFLATFHPLAATLRKHKLPTPLTLSLRFIQTSLDSYPLEFLDIQSDYTNLYTVEDQLKDLQFNKEDLRLQIERELKSKWLLTRLTALGGKYQASQLFGLLKDSFTALLPVFKGFCYLGGVSIPRETNLLIDAMEEILHTDLKVLRYLQTQQKAPSLQLMNTLFNDYLRLLHMFGEKIDSWKQA